jgi:hypothetical protein
MDIDGTAPVARGSATAAAAENWELTDAP